MFGRLLDCVALSATIIDMMRRKSMKRAEKRLEQEEELEVFSPPR